MSGFKIDLWVARAFLSTSLLLAVIAHFQPWERVTLGITSVIHPKFTGRPQLLPMRSYTPLFDPEAARARGKGAPPNYRIGPLSASAEIPTGDLWKELHFDVRSLMSRYRWPETLMNIVFVVNALFLSTAPFIVGMLSRSGPLLWVIRVLAFFPCGWFAWSFWLFTRQPHHPDSAPLAGYWLVVAALWLQALGLLLVPKAPVPWRDSAGPPRAAAE